MNTSQLESELKNFLDDSGRLIKYPAKRRAKMLALFYLAAKFEPDRRYAEKEVNELLKQWHCFEDWAMLRRDLFDRRFLGREQDCTFYWLEKEQPVLSDFGVV